MFLVFNAYVQDTLGGGYTQHLLCNFIFTILQGVCVSLMPSMCQQSPKRANIQYAKMLRCGGAVPHSLYRPWVVPCQLSVCRVKRQLFSVLACRSLAFLPADLGSCNGHRSDSSTTLCTHMYNIAWYIHLGHSSYSIYIQ